MHVFLLALVLFMTGARVYGAALDVWKCQDKVVVFDGPAGTGKTYSDLLKADFVARKYPGCRQLFVRDTRTSMSQSVLVEYEDAVLGFGSPIKSGASRPQRQSYLYPNGSEIVVGGLDNADRVMSTQYDRVYVFEATECDEESISKLTTRLRNGKTAFGQIILECNPSYPSHWIRKWFTEGFYVTEEVWQPDGSVSLEKKLVYPARFKSKHNDNPRWYDQSTGAITPDGKDYIYNTLGMMSGHLRKRLLDGEWAGADGVVYDNFNRDVHVVEIERTEWPETIIACDDGISNPFVALLIRIDEDDRMHVEKEVYASHLLIDRKVKAVQGLDASCEVIVDPAAAQLIAEMRNAGVAVMQANNKREDGINRVHSRLGNGPDDAPRLTVDPSCVNTIREFESYMRKKNPNGEGYRDEPEKVNDHAMDALRYAVNRIDGRSKMELITASSDEGKADGWDGW